MLFRIRRRVVAYYLHFLHVLAQFFCTVLFHLHFFLSFLHFFFPALSLQGLFPPDPPELHLLQVTGHCFCIGFDDLHFLMFFLHELHFLFLFFSLQGVEEHLILQLRSPLFFPTQSFPPSP